MQRDFDAQSVIDRREAIRRVSALLGGAALVGGSGLLAACGPKDAASIGSAGATSDQVSTLMPFTAEEIAFLDEIAETILPETKTPGAKAAHTGAFMALMVTDCYTLRDQQVFRAGMGSIEQAAQRSSSNSFVASTAAEKLTLLERLDAEQRTFMSTRKPDEPAHYFRMMKELALLGYFTSEIGYTRAMRYIEAPGRFDPCAPHAPGDKTWASHA